MKCIWPALPFLPFVGRTKHCEFLFEINYLCIYSCSFYVWARLGIEPLTYQFQDRHSMLRPQKSGSFTETNLTTVMYFFLLSVLQYQFGEDMETSLLQPLEASLQKITNGYCGRTSHLFTKRLEQSIRSVQHEGRPGHILPWPGSRFYSSQEEKEEQKKMERVISLHNWF